MLIAPMFGKRFACTLTIIRWFTLAITACVSVNAVAKTIPIAFTGEQNSALENGVKQGLLEANLQGEFLGVTYELVPLGPQHAVAAIVVAGNDETILQVAEMHPDIPVFNIRSTSDRLRARCLPNLFHMMPSQQMLSDAEAQWRTKHPQSAARARAWHRTFKKYAASQLNSRYHETFKQDMNDAAWAGWAATKLLADVLIRAPELMSESLIDELKTNVAFDGQKGIDMTFRETGQLAQPLLLIDKDEIKGEAPVRGVVDITDLDSLGEVSCPK